MRRSKAVCLLALFSILSLPLSGCQVAAILTSLVNALFGAKTATTAATTPTTTATNGLLTNNGVATTAATNTAATAVPAIRLYMGGQNAGAQNLRQQIQNQAVGFALPAAYAQPASASSSTQTLLAGADALK